MFTLTKLFVLLEYCSNIHGAENSIINCTRPLSACFFDAKTPEAKKLFTKEWDMESLSDSVRMVLLE